MLYLPSLRTYTKVEVNSFIKVINCNFIALEKEMIYSLRFLECNELIYVMSGELYLKVEQQEFVIREGEALIIPFYKTLAGTRKTDGSIKFWTIEFSCSDSLIDGICEKTIAVKENAYFFNELLTMLGRGITQESEENSSSDAVLLLMLQTIRRNTKEQIMDFSMLNSIMDYINENIGKMITIDEIAGHFNYNKDYIMKLFKAKCGVTIKKYINDKKLTVAKRLLTTTEMSVEKIGASIGFEEAELFQKYFKYHEKVTPQRYRQMHR